ncbi:histidine--tRNA ligase [Microbacterium sp.]|uniref:histidine--tRNA ligase n=1 Tax=Microbacterium sp. TaxID=51671 RepID=UPI0039E70157
MRDFLPADKARRERVLAVIRDRYRAHGFDEIETPVVEEYARLHAGIGGDNEKLSFSVLKRGMDADAIRANADDPAALSDLGLRYDLTVPLARFYASHRAELPAVFRSIQIAPVWRAERPQKGRYRQFLQCDIDIIGDASARAEAELLAASLDTLDALGLDGGTIRVNDRRILRGMLNLLGIGDDVSASALITLDKLDKIGPDGVVAELRDNGVPADAAAEYLRTLLPGTDGASSTGLSVPVTLEAILRVLPPVNLLPEEVRQAAADLAGIAEAVAAARGIPVADVPLVFDPFLVRGMGYYTGTIFELAHPSVGFSLGGGGRYDGMIGRFLGQDVPAVGFSLGFERIVDLVSPGTATASDAVVLVHDRDVPVAQLARLKAAFVGEGARVRLEQRTKNLKGLLERATADGYTSFATVTAGQERADLQVKTLD